VLLYVLCHANEPLTQEQVAKSCKVQPSAVEEALIFWQDANVLLTAPAVPAVGLQKTAAAPQQSPVPPAAPPQQNPAPAKPAAQVQSSSRPHLMPGEIAERIKKNRALAEMFRTAEQFARRTLNHTEQESLIWMHEYLGLPPDVILMLAYYCAQTDCFSVRYMEKIAVEWQERGITTHQLAQADITRRAEARSYTGKIMTLFQMDRRPTAKQQEYIDGWQNSGFSLDLIEVAYEKTRDKKGDKLSFSYLNGILRKWEASGIRTPEAAAQEDAAYYAARQQNAADSAAAKGTGKAAGSSIDMDEVEKLMNPL
jgi:DnaD/phage-associated family protein